MGENVFGVDLLPHLLEEIHAFGTVTINNFLSLILIRIVCKDVRIMTSETFGRSDNVVHQDTRRAIRKSIITRICPGHRQLDNDKCVCPASQAEGVCGGAMPVDVWR